MKANIRVLLCTWVLFNIGCLFNDTEKYLNDLESENIKVKNNAIYYLGKKKKSHAVPILIEHLKDAQPKEIKISVIEALGEIGQETAVGVLIDVLKYKDNEIRKAVCNALGKIKDPKAIKPLINVLDNKDIRLYAIWALGNIRNKDAIPVLTELLNDKDNYTRYNAAQSLKKIGGMQ